MKIKDIDTNIHIDKRRVSLQNILNPEQKEFFSYIKSISIHDYSLEVETFCIDDSLTEYQPIPFFQYPIVTDQKVTFRNKDSIVIFFWFTEQESFDVTSKNHNIVNSMSLLIYCISYIKGDKSDVFMIEALGLQYARKVYYAFYTLEGDFLYSHYNNDALKINIEKGINRDTLFHNFGFDFEDINKNTNKIRFDPPMCD